MLKKLRNFAIVVGILLIPYVAVLGPPFLLKWLNYGEAK